MSFLIDTNVISELSRKKPDPAVIAWLADLRALVLSAVTIEELTFGIERLPEPRRTAMQGWFAELMALRPDIIPVDYAVAELAGRLRAARESAGRPVEQADMLIAATARLHELTVVTRNVADFADTGVRVHNPYP